MKVSVTPSPYYHLNWMTSIKRFGELIFQITSFLPYVFQSNKDNTIKIYTEYRYEFHCNLMNSNIISLHEIKKFKHKI